METMESKCIINVQPDKNNVIRCCGIHATNLVMCASKQDKTEQDLVIHMKQSTLLGDFHFT